MIRRSRSAAKSSLVKYDEGMKVLAILFLMVDFAMAQESLMQGPCEEVQGYSLEANTFMKPCSKYPLGSNFHWAYSGRNQRTR